MTERPKTTEELFYRIKTILKEKDNLRYYRLEISDPVPIRTYQFDLKHNRAYVMKEFIWVYLESETG